MDSKNKSPMYAENELIEDTHRMFGNMSIDELMQIENDKEGRDHSLSGFASALNSSSESTLVNEASLMAIDKPAQPHWKLPPIDPSQVYTNAGWLNINSLWSVNIQERSLKVRVSTNTLYTMPYLVKKIRVQLCSFWFLQSLGSNNFTEKDKMYTFFLLSLINDGPHSRNPS